MADILRPGICVIGGGPAGLTVAAEAAALGVPVVLVEMGLMGGDHLGAARVQSSALIAAARQARAAARGRFGPRREPADADVSRIMEHVRNVAAAVARNDSAERFTGMGVTVLHGAARFTDRATLLVGEVTVRARRFVIATGARPAIPPIPNLETVPYLTNATLFALNRLPLHLVIIGAGSVGIEMAQAFRNLGSAVTVLERARALAAGEPELAALLVETLRGEGVAIHEGVEVTRVARRGRHMVRATFAAAGGRAQTVEGTHLLIATGRRPDLAELGLAEAGVTFDAGGVQVNDRMRTRNRRIYAIGDAAGGSPQTHWASHQASLVVRSILFRFGGRIEPDMFTSATFTDPELAQVGLSEEAARLRHGDIRILRWPFSETDRGHAEGATRGLVKVVTTRRGRILGAASLGRNAGELIAPWVLAVSRRHTVKSMASAVFPYPTMAEAGRNAAMSFYTPKPSVPSVKWLVRFLARLG